MTANELANKLDDINSKIWTEPDKEKTERLKVQFNNLVLSHFNLIISALRAMRS